MRKNRSMKKIIIAIICALIIIPLVLYFIAPGLVYKGLITMARKQAKLMVKTIVVGDHTIAYSEGGEGDVILLIHGFGGDKDNWIRFAKFLTPAYHVIIPDLPGFGESTRLPDANYSIMVQVTRLNAFTEKLRLKRLHIVGNSMGGSIAGNFTAEYPQMIASLALFDSAGVKSPVKSERDKLIEKGFNPLLVYNPDDYDRLMKFIFFKQPQISGGIKRALAEKAASNKAFNEKVYRDVDTDRYDLEKKLGRISAPTLIVWGDRDRAIDISSVKIFEIIKNHKTAIMKNCGHLPMLERPEEAASIYLDFLKGLKQGVTR